MSHDGTDTNVWGVTGDIIFTNYADDKDIVFRSDDGSGGVAEYFRVDGANGRINFEVDLKFNDSKKARFGASDDLEIYHDTTNSVINNKTGHLQIYNNADDGDISFISDDGSGGTTEYFRVDGGEARTIYTKDLKTLDDTKILIGNGADLQIYHNATDSKIENSTRDLRIVNFADDKDIIFQCDDGSGGVETYFFLDGSVSAGDPYTVFPDNSNLSIGSGYDLRLKHDGTDSNILNVNGDLVISNTADDKDIIFKSDDGSGGTSTYFFLDGSNSHTNFQLNARWVDNAKAQFGNSGDLEIYHDGSNSYINDDGTGDLYIQTNGTNMFLRNKSNGNTFIAMNTGTEAVSLRQGGSEKLVTTSTGVEVTGTVDATQSSTSVPVLRLTDDGVCNYDFIFPDDATIKLETSTSSTKTFKLLNAGSGDMNLEVSGSLSKGSGSFKIDHPVKPDTHYLYHSFVESPLTDLIYRGKAKLVEGKASINIDEHFGMTDGTFVALVDDKQIFTTNEDTWDAVKGTVEENQLHIECQNESFEGYVSWLVIGDRKDKHIIAADWTDEKGKPILEVEK